MQRRKGSSASAASVGTALLLVAIMAVQSGCGGIVVGPSTAHPLKGGTVGNTFGFHVHLPFQHWPSATFGYWRMWDAGVDWARIERQPGVFDFSLLDQFVSLAEQHNVKIIYVAGNTPQWAATDPTHVGTQGLPGATSPPTDISIWQNFIQTLSARYRGRIYGYEIWNEVNLAGYWTGTMDQMLEMARIAYQTIKQNDPSAFVLAPSLVAGSGLDYFDKFMSAGGVDFTDAIPYHLYSTDPVPEEVIDFDQKALTIAEKFNKPIWDVEFGWGPWGSFNDQDAAAFVARSLILQAAQGITHIIWYAWDDRGPWVHLFMVRSDFVTPTPAATAFEQVTSWLIGTSISCASLADGSWQCPLVRNTRTSYVVWNPNGQQTFTVPSSWAVSTAIDLQGNTQPILNGQVQIGPSPVLLEP